MTHTPFAFPARRLFLALSLVGLLTSAPSTGAPLTDQFVSDLREFLALPNDASSASDMAANQRWLEQALGERGFKTEALGRSDYALLFAQRQAPAAQRTLLVYFHFDGQPVDPSRWEQESPYEATLKRLDDGRFVAQAWPPAGRYDRSRMAGVRAQRIG